jgi:gliding motility-associated-like protein
VTNHNRMKIYTTKNRLLLTFVILLATMSGAFSQTFQVNGDASNHGNGLVKLTSSVPSIPGAWQTASAWSTTKHDLTQPFDRTFAMFFGCESGPDGGDGITFTFQNQGINAVGGSGGFLGIGGVTPAISIEFDTYDGTPHGGGNEIPEDHIAVILNGDVNNGQIFEGPGGVTTSVQPVLNSRDLEDCAQNANDYYTVRIVWDPATQKLMLYEEGVLTVTYTNDLINNVFGGVSDVYWGFTAATGSASNEQWIAPAGTIIPWECTAGTSCCTPFTVVSNSPTTICNNPITLDVVDDAFLRYEWSTGETTPSIDISAPGTYTLNVMQNQFGTSCPGTLEFNIATSGATASISGDATLCNDGTTAPVSVAVAGNMPVSFVYAIDGVAQPPVTGVTASPYVIQGSSPHTYTLVSVSDNSGCNGLVGGTAVLNTYTGVPVGQDDSFSAPGTATLSVTDEGGVYEWYDAPTGGNLVHTGASYTTPTLNNTTTYYVENTAIPGFISKSVALLNQAAGDGPAPGDKEMSGLPKAVLALDFVANESFTLEQITFAVNVILPWETSVVSVTITNQTTSASYTRDSVVTTALAAGEQLMTIPLNYSVVAGNSYRISYEGQNSGGALGGAIRGIMYWQLVAASSFPINTNPELSITTIGAPPTRYPGMFDWRISKGSPAAQCGRTPVVAIACPEAVLSGTTTICNDGTATAPLSVAFTATGPWMFTYSIDGVAQTPVTGVTTSPYVFQSATGSHTYALTAVSNTTGCAGQVSGTAVVTAQNLPQAADVVYPAPGSVQLSVSNPGTDTFEWYDAPTGGTLLHTGTSYTTPELNDTVAFYIENVTVAGLNCGRTRVRAIPDYTALGDLFIPNMVTPNNDGQNDYFKILSLPNGSGLEIYNRWGERVYASSNYDNLWAANNVSDGLYYYLLKLPDGNDFRGWLHVIR